MAEMRRLLVTGGCGFIGSNFVRYVLQNRPDWQITNLDCLSYSGNLENLRDVESEARYRFVRGNVCDPALATSLAAEADAIVHLAAESHVDRSIHSARPFFETNVVGCQTMLEAARTAWADRSDDHRGRVVNVSTDEVYGSMPSDPQALPFSEQSPLAPSNPYSASKAAGDLAALAYHRTYGLDVIVTRCSNNFGPYQFPEKIIPLFITRLATGLSVPLYGDGGHRRDWLHVDDHCEALLAVLQRGKSGEIYNIAAGNEHTNLELARRLVEMLGRSDDAIEHVRDRPAHDRRYAMDGNKTRDELGWRPGRSQWPEALETTVRWYLANPAWWKPLVQGLPAGDSSSRK